jgi:putative DNA primase/helicase
MKDIPKDFVEELRSRTDIVEVIEKRIDLKKESGEGEYRALCPFHKENTPSFTVTQNSEKKVYYCFGCGAGGDALNFVMEYDQINFVDAVKLLAKEKGMEIPSEEKKKVRKTPMKIVSAYDYLTEEGELVYQVCRMDPKDFRQRKKGTDGKEWDWKIKGLVPLPYRLPQFLAKPDATIVIPEGEKDADNLAALDLLATTNSGGAGKWQNEICHYFKGRRVVILPDKDPQTSHPKTKELLFHSDGRPRHVGQDHADDVARKLTGIAESIRILKLPNLPNKGDPSDWINAGGTREEFIELCKLTEEWSDPQGPDIKTEALADPSPPLPTEKDEPEDDDIEFEEPPQKSPSEPPFKCLGFDDGYYYFLPHKTLQVFPISAGSMTSSAQLLTLSPLEWWEHAFPSKTGVEWLSAANACIRWSENVGTFDSGAIRGRGAWFDDGRSVLHLGNQLLVDNVPVRLHDLDTKFIYEKKPALEALKLGEPLKSDEALGLYTVTNSMNWQKPINAVLLAGWCVIAPICGAVPWRPHIWVTGQKGTGKSWVIENIIAPAIGGSALVVQGNSTEAGIRQKLRQDARPVMFDEAEGESRNSRSRMQHVLELARQASSDSLAEIAKGTAGGKALTYRVRSAFMLGSINVGLSHASDKSRFTVLSLTKGQHGEAGRKQFEELQELVNNTLTKEWCASLRARTYSLIPVIRENAAVLAKAAAEHIGNQRAGDQLGALLAGCYSLKSEELITLDSAKEWVKSQDWGLEQDEKADSDEHQLLSEILHSLLRVDTHGGIKTRSISELVSVSVGDYDDEECTKRDADQTMARHGLRVIEKSLVVSESHPEIRKMLDDSPWSGGWARILERITGAQKIKACRFSGVTHRAVSIPVDEIGGEASEGSGSGQEELAL